MRVVRRAFVYIIDAAFTACSIWIALHPRATNDRLIGTFCAIFFGGGGLFLVANGLINRRAWAAPSVPLRIDANGEKRLDRLDLYSSPARIALGLSASALFGVSGVMLWILEHDVFGYVVASVSIGMALLAAGAAIWRIVTRAPLISFDLDFLSYREPFRSVIIVRYDDVRSFHVTEIASQRFVCLEAFDDDAVLEMTADPRLRRRLLRSIRWVGVPWVLPNQTHVAADDLLDIVAVYVRESRTRAIEGYHAPLS